MSLKGLLACTLVLVRGTESDTVDHSLRYGATAHGVSHIRQRQKWRISGVFDAAQRALAIVSFPFGQRVQAERSGMCLGLA